MALLLGRHADACWTRVILKNLKVKKRGGGEVSLDAANLVVTLVQ